MTDEIKDDVKPVETAHATQTDDIFSPQTRH